MVQSCFPSLAAWPLSAASRGALAVLAHGHHAWTTSPLKTRVGVSRSRASGRLSRRAHRRSMFTPGSRPCAYRTASGRGKWNSRDPSEKAGGMSLYGFVSNHPIDDVDAFGLMRWGDLMAIKDRVNAAVRDVTCCCDKRTALRATITGTASGQQVTDTVQLEKIGCVDTIAVVQYYWSDCATAQHDYAEDHSPSRPRGRQAWQDYGWHEGGNPQTQSHRGNPRHWWDMSDNSHWNWQVAVLYVFCGQDGRYHDRIAMSNAVEWDWHRGGWTNPHDGSRGLIDH